MARLLRKLSDYSDLKKTNDLFMSLAGKKIEMSKQWRLEEKAEKVKDLIPLYSQDMFYLIEHLEEFLDDFEPADNSDFSFSTEMVNQLGNSKTIINNIVIYFLSSQYTAKKTMPGLARTIEDNALKASRIQRNTSSNRQLLYPEDQKNKTALELVEMYLINTPFYDFLLESVGFEIPPQIKFEHTHILGGSGHGKTQLLSMLLLDDLQSSKQGKCGFAVIDSQGDLIDQIKRLDDFNPTKKGNFSDKLILIEPSDIEHPISLSLFDVDLSNCSKVDKERLLNQAIELYTYIFSSLMTNEMTAKQTTMFKYLIALMIEIPNSTIYTLKELLEEEIITPKGEQPNARNSKFYEHFLNLDFQDQDFFLNYYFKTEGDSFKQNKKQVLNRLLGLLQNKTMSRIFSSTKSKLNIFDAMNQGKIILINTDKDNLQQSNCSFLGRFFVALFTQSALRRSSLPEDDRMPFYLYIDECHDYLDDNAETIFNQSRKYKLGLTVAHQNTGQLASRLSDSINSSTSIKFVGGASYKDSNQLSKEMRTSFDFVQNMKKRQLDNCTDFACFVKNHTPTAIRLTVPFGTLKNQPRMTNSAFEILQNINRNKYSQNMSGETQEPGEKQEARTTAPGFKLGKRELI